MKLRHARVVSEKPRLKKSNPDILSDTSHFEFERGRCGQTLAGALAEAVMLQSGCFGVFERSEGGAATSRAAFTSDFGHTEKSRPGGSGPL